MSRKRKEVNWGTGGEVLSKRKAPGNARGDSEKKGREVAVPRVRREQRDQKKQTAEETT